MFEFSARVVRKMTYVTALVALAIGSFAACTSDPFASTPKPVLGPVEEEEICESSANWLPTTPPVPLYLPEPHPASECPFYRGAWQNFLVAMQPMDAKGTPALLSYPPMDSVFIPKIPHPANRSFLGDIKQAGGRQILIDQNNNSLYYGIHINPVFAEFIKGNQLQTAEQLQAYPSDPVKKTLEFPGGVAEYKTAWQVVEGDAATVQKETENYISMETTVPTLTQDPVKKNIVEDRNTPRTVVVRLLAIHVVFTLPGHPEFIWGSFEHSTGAPDVRAADGHRDVAPTFAGENPLPTDAENRKKNDVVSANDFILYKGGTPAMLANNPIPEAQLNLVGQKFMGQATSIYRMYPAAKSNTTHPDNAITSLNHNVEELFKNMAGMLPAGDKRGNYRLVGAQWMDKPRFFDVNIPIQNDLSSPFLKDHTDRVGIKAEDKKALDPAVLLADIAANGSDSDFSILAGEDRMSSTSMESFTQGVNTFPNCFTCHNTQAIVANGVPFDPAAQNQVKLLDPGLLNVSHVLSQFLLEEYEAGLAATPAQ